jgi:hypothetical protein
MRRFLENFFPKRGKEKSGKKENNGNTITFRPTNG